MLLPSSRFINFSTKNSFFEGCPDYLISHVDNSYLKLVSFIKNWWTYRSSLFGLLNEPISSHSSDIGLINKYSNIHKFVLKADFHLCILFFSLPPARPPSLCRVTCLILLQVCVLWCSITTWEHQGVLTTFNSSMAFTFLFGSSYYMEDF